MTKEIKCDKIQSVQGNINKKGYKMNKKEFVCSICGESIKDLDEYVKHVKACADQEKAKDAKKRTEEVNAALKKVNTAKTYYEECLHEFKTKYPKEYMDAFGCKDTEKEKYTSDKHYKDANDFIAMLLGLN